MVNDMLKLFRQFYSRGQFLDWWLVGWLCGEIPTHFKMLLTNTLFPESDGYGLEDEDFANRLTAEEEDGEPALDNTVGSAIVQPLLEEIKTQISKNWNPIHLKLHRKNKTVNTAHEPEAELLSSADVDKDIVSFT